MLRILSIVLLFDVLGGCMGLPSPLLAQRFLMRDKNALYFFNAPSTEFARFLQSMGSGVGIGGAGVSTAQIGH